MLNLVLSGLFVVADGLRIAGDFVEEVGVQLEQAFRPAHVVSFQSFDLDEEFGWFKTMVEELEEAEAVLPPAPAPVPVPPRIPYGYDYPPYRIGDFPPYGMGEST